MDLNKSNIEIAIEALLAEKNRQAERLNVYDDIVEKIKLLSDGVLNIPSTLNSNSQVGNNLQNKLDSKERFKGYKPEDKFSNKLEFIVDVLKRPFRNTDILDIIEELEGPERRREYANKISQQVSYMMRNRTFIGQKYGSNVRTFYYRTEWADWDGKQFTIKKEYKITEEEFIKAEVPMHKRNNFDWLPKEFVNQ